MREFEAQDIDIKIHCFPCIAASESRMVKSLYDHFLFLKLFPAFSGSVKLLPKVPKILPGLWLSSYSLANWTHHRV
jgi:hypothetical protein